MKIRKKSTQFNSEQQEYLFNFKQFVHSEGFTETSSNAGNFNLGAPIFYKRVANDKFLVFNIPFNEVQKQFYVDFWIINTESKNFFLVRKVDDKKLKDIRLGFTIENIGLYHNLIF